MNVLLAATAGLLFAIGTYLVIQRKLSRIIIGIGLLTHGANVLFLMSGRRGLPPLVGSGPDDDFSDPLPQAMSLTAIVISFGVTAFLLALAYRSWVLTDDDEVEDDVTDRLISRGGGFEDEELSDAISDEDDDEAEPAR
jgi:multicomponent Na+:H+ antiporter subunit C